MLAHYLCNLNPHILCIDGSSAGRWGEPQAVNTDGGPPALIVSR